MALLDDCYFCSLSVAVSVIGVYTMVAYAIAFVIETWWIVNSPVPLPSPAYVLCTGFLIVSMCSAILLRGLSLKKSLLLLLWLLAVAALAVPEALLVYFMSVHYWNIRSLYGLMELTCWICRAIINVAGLICVQSLYSTWREEKEVLRTLRDLNMTRVIPNRRNSVTSLGNGYVKAPQRPVLQTQLNNGALMPVPVPHAPLHTNTHRSGSMLKAPGVFLGAAPVPPPWLLGNEFNASQFTQSLRRENSRSVSLADLRSVGSDPGGETPRKTMSVVDFPVENSVSLQTQSLDRRMLRQRGMQTRPPAADRLMSAYFQTRAAPTDMYGPNINTFYPGKPTSRSKHSLCSDSDDFQKYRDIAL